MSENEGLVKLSIDNVHKDEINMKFVIKSLIYDAISEKHLCTLMSTCGHFAFFACSRKKIYILYIDSISCDYGIRNGYECSQKCRILMCKVSLNVHTCCYG